MHTFRRKWIAFSLLSGCALAISSPACATEADSRFDLAAKSDPTIQSREQDALAIFLGADDSAKADVADIAPDITPAAIAAITDDAIANGSVATDSDKPAIFQDWVAVDSSLLEEMRGGFDLAPGLKVSFGIERVVNLNGVLQTATRIEVPDAGRLIQSMQFPVVTPSGQPAGTQASDPAGAITLPVLGNLGNGAAALIQNGSGNTFFSGTMPPEAAATVIQNSASNQTIQSLTVINAATNSLELLKGANLQSTLFDALTRSTRLP